MVLEVRTTEDLIRIAVVGGGFHLKAGVRSTEDLIRIAVAANQGGGRVYFSGLSVRSTDDLIRISAAGKGAVVFED
jgi:hypothetical protein